MSPNSIKFLFFFCICNFFSIKTFAGGCTGTASFTYSSTHCEKQSVTFTNTSSSSTSASTYYWIWGDKTPNSSSTSSITTATHTFSSTGVDTVWLVRVGTSCKDSTKLILTINAKPIPDFSYSPSGTNCMGTNITYTDKSTYSSSSSSYLWDLGDGSTSTNQSPTHSYKSYGTGSKSFTASLTVTDNNGCVSNTKTYSLSVNQAVKPVLDDSLNSSSSTNKGPFRRCNGSSSSQSFTIGAQNNTGSSSSISNYNISWGDGSSNFSGTSFYGTGHTYTSLGVYNLTFTIKSSNGCIADTVIKVINESNPSVGLSSPGSTSGCAPQGYWFKLSSKNVSPTTNFTWDFGDGSSTIVWDYTKSNDSIYHVFTKSSCGNSPTGSACSDCYLVKAVAKNACNISTQATVDNVVINIKPFADFSVSTNLACAGSTTVSFTNKSVSDACTGTSSYTWDFGDGTSTSTTTSPTHKYNKQGNFTIKLKAHNDCGDSILTKTIEVDSIPVSDFTYISSPTSLCAPAVVDFTNKSSGMNLSYSWSVNATSGWSYTNSTSSTDKNPQITFTSSGSYNVTLTTSNSCGSTSKKTTIVVPSKPSVTLSSIPDNCGSYTLTPSATYNNGGNTITGYNWTFTGGSPSSSSSQNPTGISYSTPGSYTITVTATNSCGTSSAASQSFKVNAYPLAKVRTDTSICLGSSIYIGAPSVSGSTYSWSSSPAGYSNTNSNPSVNPSGTTKYSMTETSAAGCKSTNSVTITVNSLPTVSAGKDETICISVSPYSLTGQSPSGGSWSGSGVNSSGTFSPNTAGVGNVTLTYAYTDPSTKCSNSSTKKITVFALPTVSTSAADTFCNTSTTTTLSGSPSGGTWTGKGVTSAGVFTPSTAGNGITTLYYHVTNSNGCTDSAKHIVNVVNPSTVKAGSNDTVCVNTADYNLSGYSPTGGSWSGTGITSGDKFSPATAGAGTFTLTYSVGKGTCKVSDTKIVKVNTLPTVSAGKDETICISVSPYSLTGQSPSGGSWSGTGVSSSGTFTPYTAGAGIGTLTYSFKDPSTKCSNSSTKKITVFALPTVSTSAADTFCNTSTTTTLSGSPSGGTWTGKGVTSAGVFTPSTAGNGITTLYYHVTNSNGCTDSAKHIVNVVNPSTVKAGSNDTVCINASDYNLSGYSPTGGSWSGTGITSGDKFSPATAGAGTFTLTYSVGKGTCKVSDTKIVKVNTLPTVSAGKDEIICISVSPYSLTGQSPSGGSWSGTGVSSTGTFTPYTAGVGIGTLTYSFKDPSTKCSNSSTKKITVFALPTVSTSAADTFCNTSTTTTLSGSPSGGTWTGKGVTFAGVFTPSTAGNGITTLYYHVTNSNGCTDSAKHIVNVVNPSTVKAGSNDTVCINAFNYNLSGYSPSGGSWSGTGITSGDKFSPATAGAGTFTLTYSVGKGTCKVSDTKIVKVNTLPTISAGKDETICISVSPYSLTGQSPSGGSWSGTGVSSTGTFTPYMAGTGTGTLTYSYTDPSTKCSNSSTKKITVFALPTVSTSAADTFCNTSTTTTLSGSPSGGTWTGKGVTSAGVFTPSTAGNGITTLYYHVTNSNGCTDSAKHIVNVVNPSTVKAGSDDTVCINASDYNLSGYSPSGGSWSGTGITSGDKFSPATAGAGAFTLIYSVGKGTCKVSDTKVVKVNALPIVDAGKDETICISVPPYSLSGQSPSGGSWTGTGVSASGTFTPYTAGAGTGTLTYSYTDPKTKCTNTSTKKITVNALPVVSTDPADTFCNTSITATLKASPTGGNWTGKGVTSSGVFTPSNAGVGIITLYYHFTDTKGCTDSAKHIVNVVNPSTVKAGSNDTVCINASDYNLSGYSPAGGSWSGTGITTGDKFSPSTAGAGAFTLTYSVGKGTCKVTDTKVVKVNALPIVDAGKDETICISVPPYTISGQSPAGGSWTGTGVSASGTFTPYTAGAGTGILTYSYTDPKTKCTNTSTKKITVNALPVVSTDPADTFCNTSITATLNGKPTGGSWSGKGVTSSGVFTPSNAGVGIITLYYHFTDSKGCTDSAKHIVNVVNPSTVKAGSNDTVCINASDYNLSGYSPTGGSWSGTGITSGDKFSPATAGAGAFTLIYSVGKGTCKVTDTKVVKVNALPIVDAGKDETICISVPPYSLSGQSPSGGSWTGTGVSASGTFTPYTAGAGTGTLSYSYTDPKTKCTNTSTKKITVNALPVVSTDPADTFCNTSITATLKASPTGGNWTGKGVTSSGVFTPSNAGVGIITLYYHFTDTKGCTDSAKHIVNVVNPSTVKAGSNDTVCINASDYNLFGYSPAGGSWSGTGITTGDKFSPSTAGAGAFTLTYSVGKGTCKVTDSKVVKVNALPIVDAGKDETICISVPPYTLSGQSPTGGSWTGTGVSASGTFTPYTAGAGTGILTYSYTDPKTKCTNSSTKKITVNALPIVSTDPADTFCNTSITATLNGKPTGGSWTGKGVNSLGIFTPSLAGVGITTLYYHYTDANGCTDSAIHIVNVVNPAIVSAGPNDSVCINTPDYQLQNFSPSGGSWSGTGVSYKGIFSASTSGIGIFKLTYSVGKNTCKVSSTKFVKVNALPIVKLSSQTPICYNATPVNLKGESPTGGIWSGNGITDSKNGLFNPKIAGTGFHTITYNYTDPKTNCSNFDTASIFVIPLPVPAFSYDTLGCITKPISFIDQSTNTVLYQWNFGDGLSSTLQSPSHAFQYTGKYNVRLIGISKDGCIDTTIKIIRITKRPYAFFTANPTSGPGPLTVQFANNSIGEVEKYLWDFANGQTSTLKNPDSVIFKQAVDNDTTYLTRLTVANLCGDSTYLVPIKVFPLPKAIFGTNVNSGCTPLTVKLINKSTGKPTRCFWDFGDGDTLTVFKNYKVPFFHKYYTDTSIRTYTIRLIAINKFGKDTTSWRITVFPSHVTAFFNVNKKTVCQGDSIKCTDYSVGGNFISWNFGDGNLDSNTTNPSHVYKKPGTYIIVQKVSNGCGYDSFVNTVIVRESPIPRWNYSPACVFQNMQFINKSENISSNLWWFGDGDSSNLLSPEHIYKSSGKFIVKLKIRSPLFNCSATLSDTVIVDSLPKPRFIPEPDKGCRPLDIIILNKTTNGDYYTWNFGDGNLDSGKAPNHIFKDSGSYFIKMIAINLKGCKDSITVPVYVFPYPISAFDYSEQLEKESHYDINHLEHLWYDKIKISFANNSQKAISYKWLINDSIMSTDKNAGLYFQASGLYVIKLVAINQFGCTDTATQFLFIPDTIIVPNVFTPNADGHNEQFKIRGNYFPGYAKNTFKSFSINVYNKWGELMFHTNDPNKGWDGTYKGLPCLMDVFVYNIQAQYNYDLHYVNLKGNVSLIK